MPVKRLILLAVILMICCGLYLTLGARGNWDFVLQFRGGKLAALIAVAVAISTSTLLFQTVAQNRILTPSIMGFDSLYILIVTVMVFFFGGRGLVEIGALPLFAINMAILLGASVLLFGTLLFNGSRDLTRMILTGVILGTLFRALTSFAVRLIDPNEYAHIQVSSYANFNKFDFDLFYFGAAGIAICLVFVWRIRRKLDILALGHEIAVCLGENVKQTQLLVLGVIAILVSISTALVGPVAFLGLLVVSLAHLITPSPFHATLLMTSGLVSAIILIGGQLVVERFLGFVAPLSVIIDFVGGILFLILLLKRLKK